MGSGRKRIRLKKLSAQYPENIPAGISQRLADLHNFIKSSGEIAEELGNLNAQLKKVAAPGTQPFVFTACLADNERLLRDVFTDCADVKFHSFLALGKPMLIVYLDGMTDITTLQENLIRPLLSAKSRQRAATDFVALSQTLLTVAFVSISNEPENVIKEILAGNAALLMDGIANVLIADTQKHVKRGIEGPKVEGTVKGPHDSFNETLGDNIVLIRRRARDPNLKIRRLEIGYDSKTAVALVYKANLVKPGLVETIETRLQQIKIDVVLLSELVAEFMANHPWSPFPQVHYTEKAEVVVSAVYGGRVGIMVDNTPTVMIVPCTYPAIMQSIEDYATPPVIASLIRLSRYFAALLAIFLPAVYIALISFHPGMLPTTLAISVAELRSRTPFPAFMETIFMEALLELFQEAVVRLPPKIAPAASMVGAFVIGTTVVQAGLVNPLLVVIMAATAIASYTMPYF